jgi:SH3-like domain-containing protein
MARRDIENVGRASGMLLVLVVAGAQIGLPQPADQSQEPEVRITGRVVNVRDQPSLAGKVVFQLRQGDTARLLEDTAKWLRVATPEGRSGWVYRPLTEVIEVEAPPPASTAPAARSPVAAEELSVDHDKVGCVVAGQHPRFEACLTPAEDVGRAQIHFHAADGDPWYAVDLKPDGTCFSAYLPKPQKRTRQFTYYVHALDRSFNATQIPAAAPDDAYRVQVVKRERDCAAGSRLARSVAKAGASILVFLAHPGSGAAAAASGGALAGFSMDAVVMSSVAGASTTAVTTGGGAAAGGAGGGSSSALLVGAGVAAAGAGVYAVTKIVGGDSESESHTGAPETVTGTWGLEVRCQGRTENASTATIRINQTAGGSFSGTAPGTDYDGDTFTLRISGTYVASSGQISGRLTSTFTSGTVRVDTFSTVLRSTDTGFFALDCVEDCGCAAEMRLHRLD